MDPAARRGRVGRSGKLAARVVPVSTLDVATRDAMWGLFSTYYDDVARDAFERDLAGKRDVILARDAGDASVQGFSTLTWDHHGHAGRRFVSVFSGDTIVSQAYWGQPVLQAAFGRYVTRLKLRHPSTPVYWFLISKGYKTYLLLARNFAEHWPRAGRATPPWERGVLDLLARERFGDAWRRDLGIVRFPRPAGRLKDGVAPLAEDVLALPEARFFHEANPGWTRGDELACLGKVTLLLLPRYLAKQLRRRARRRPEGTGWAAS